MRSSEDGSSNIQLSAYPQQGFLLRSLVNDVIPSQQCSITTAQVRDHRRLGTHPRKESASRNHLSYHPVKRRDWPTRTVLKTKEPAANHPAQTILPCTRVPTYLPICPSTHLSSPPPSTPHAAAHPESLQHPHCFVRAARLALYALY